MTQIWYELIMSWLYTVIDCYRLLYTVILLALVWICLQTFASKVTLVVFNTKYMCKFFFWSEIKWVFFEVKWAFSDISKMLDFDRDFCSVMDIKSKKKKQRYFTAIYSNASGFSISVWNLWLKKKHALRAKL